MKRVRGYYVGIDLYHYQTSITMANMFVQLIKMLNEAKGNGTSMISLILPPKSQISQTQTMLQTEYGTASNIKSRVNRQSVLGAITSAQQRLKLYNKVPPNGLIVYTGTVVTDEGKEKKMNIDFEPFKPINTSLYLCDNKFHTEALSELMETDQKYGFIVMDGHGSLYGTLSGNHREVLHKFTVDLPKKHGRGGQSALRFARLRLEKRHNYVRKVAEIAVQHFITNDRPNVAGLVLAGSADFKTELSQSDMFDQRLQAVIMAIVDVSYGTQPCSVVYTYISWVPYQFPVRPHDSRSNGGYPIVNLGTSRNDSEDSSSLSHVSGPSHTLLCMQVGRMVSTRQLNYQQKHWQMSSLSKKNDCSPPSLTKFPRILGNSALVSVTPWHV